MARVRPNAGAAGTSACGKAVLAGFIFIAALAAFVLQEVAPSCAVSLFCQDSLHWLSQLYRLVHRLP